ncbi:MAG: FTR1 family protein [Betaproteobacteria bacterium]|nr:FTR1 family protein [Betaproteobacteria bacterium]
MLATALVSFREGVEAFLIVALTLAYLRKSGRVALTPAVYAGTAAGIALSFVAGWLFSQADNQPLWEGLLAAIAAAMVLSMVVYMQRHARTMRSDIAASVDTAAARTGLGAFAGVFAFVLLMIVREGMETALVITTLARETGHGDMLAGVLSGVALAGTLAWAWARYGQRIDLRRFFQVTSIFLVLFSIQLVVYAIHEFSEAGVIPFVDNEALHVATEPYGPEGFWGQTLTYVMVLVPAAWLAWAWMNDRRNRHSARMPA